MSERITPLNIALDVYMHVQRAENRQRVIKRLGELYSFIAHHASPNTTEAAFFDALNHVHWAKYSTSQLRTLAAALSLGSPVQNLCARYLSLQLNQAAALPAKIDWADSFSRVANTVSHWWQRLQTETKMKSDQAVKLLNNRQYLSAKSTGAAEIVPKPKVKRKEKKAFVPFSHKDYEVNLSSFHSNQEEK